MSGGSEPGEKVGLISRERAVKPAGPACRQGYIDTAKVLSFFWGGGGSSFLFPFLVDAVVDVSLFG